MKATSSLASVGLLSLAFACLQAEEPKKTDSLPEGALLRFGYARMNCGNPARHLTVSPDSRWVSNYYRWFDVVEGKEKPPPVPIPNKYLLRQWFSDGSYVVEGEKHDYLVFSPKAEKPRLTIEASRENVL